LLLYQKENLQNRNVIKKMVATLQVIVLGHELTYFVKHETISVL
jgi:hypothetical protein